MTTRRFDEPVAHFYYAKGAWWFDTSRIFPDSVPNEPNKAGTPDWSIGSKLSGPFVTWDDCQAAWDALKGTPLAEVLAQLS